MSRHKLFILGALICALIFTGGLASAQTNADVMFTAKKHPAVKDWSAIDNYASNLSFSTSTSYATAAAKICQTSRTEEEKARAIFAWIAHNIAYDVNLDSSFCYSADGVWRNRKGACQGYSLLYVELAKTVGLNCEYANGNNKKNWYQYKNALGSHGWVLVKLSSGKKMLLDPTWAAGNTDMVQKTFEFDYKDAWFDVDPYYMIMSHYPSSDSWQLLNPTVSMEKFYALPRVEPDFEQLGIDGKELYDFYLTHNKAWAPDLMLAVHDVIKGGSKVNKIPMAGTLKKNEAYTFNFTIPQGQRLMIRVNGSWQNLTSDVDFSAKPTTTDDVIIGIGGSGGRIQYALVYSVSDSPSLPWANDAASINSRILAAGSGSSSGSGSSTGSTCTTNPSPAPSNPSAGRTGPVVPSVTYGDARYKGKNLTNLPTYTFTLRSSGTVTNQVSTAKPKVLVFYATYCPYAKKLNTDLAANYSQFSDVDLYLVNAYNDSDDKITKYISDNNLSALKFTSGSGVSGSEGKEAFKEYGKLTNSGTGYPFVIFLDCNNKIQYELNGCPRDNPAQTVRNIIDNYLIPKNGLPQTNTETSTGTSTGASTQTPSPAPANPASQKTDGLNIPNSINETFTLLNGSKVSSKAEGKPKVLIFFQTICGRCQSTTRSLGPKYETFSDADIYEIEINRAKKADVQKFKDSYGSAAMKFAYDEANAANGVMWRYIRMIDGNVSSIGLPVIVYIDSNNVIQKYESGKSVAYTHIREIIDGYLKVSSSECEDGVCETKPSVPENECEDGQCEVPKPAEPSKPETKPDDPEKKPSVPEKKPDVPEKKPSVPEKKPELPEKKPSVPEKKPELPEKKPSPIPDKETLLPKPPIVPEKKEPDLKNPVSSVFSLVDGGTMSASASGKPKVLVFFTTSCGRTKNFLKNLNREYEDFSSVDILFIETRKAKEFAVKTFRNNYALPEMNFAYDYSNNAKNAMSAYTKKFLPKVKTVNTPLIVFIDGDNNVQEVIHGKALAMPEFKKIIDKSVLRK